MPLLTDVFAMLGIGLVLCAGFVRLLSLGRTANLSASNGAKWLVLAIFVVLCVPGVGAALPVVAYVRGISSDLSITLVALCFWSLCHRSYGLAAISQREQTAVMLAVAGAALFMYPLALGWGPWDAYRLGWGNVQGAWGMWLSLLSLCLVCWVKKWHALPALIALALLAWCLGLMESGNLWDYLLDPWLSVFALGFVFIKYLQVFFRRLH